MLKAYMKRLLTFLSCAGHPRACLTTLGLRERLAGRPLQLHCHRVFGRAVLARSTVRMKTTSILVLVT